MTGAARVVGATCAAVALVVLCIGSAWWSVSWTSETGYGIGVWAGRLGLTRHPADSVLFPGAGWSVYGPGFENAPNNEVPFAWWFHWWGTSREGAFHLPLWLPASAAVISAAACWRSRLRAHARTGQRSCAECGYCLNGVPPASACPECGVISL
jgi:hypothetical protein